MKAMLAVTATTTVVLTGLMLAPGVLADSAYFNCECFDGAVVANSNPTCTCDCTGATDGNASLVEPFCAYPAGVSLKKSIILAVAVNQANLSSFSGTRLELSLQREFGVTGDATALRYNKIDGTSRGITNHFAPNLVVLFALRNATLASEILNTAKDKAAYQERLEPYGVLEVEVFYLPNSPTSGLVDMPFSVVWLILPAFALLISIFECCCASRRKTVTGGDSLDRDAAHKESAVEE